MEIRGQKKVTLFDQFGTHFATFDFPTLPSKGEFVEIGFPNEQVVKLFEVNRVVHKMIQEPAYVTKYVEGVPVRCENDPPWRWELQLHGRLFNPETSDENRCS